MMFFIVLIGTMFGILICSIIDKMMLRLCHKLELTNKHIGIWNKIIIIVITTSTYSISFIKFGFNILFFEAIILNSILIIISIIDIKFHIIQNKMVLFTGLIGIVFCFLGNISILDAMLGALIGGGIFFLIALIPGAIGGGDIKIMFMLGLFLGYRKILIAIYLAFIFSSISGIICILFKIKGKKDYIPLGPFLALGCFIAFHY